MPDLAAVGKPQPVAVRIALARTVAHADYGRADDRGGRGRHRRRGRGRWHHRRACRAHDRTRVPHGARGRADRGEH